MAAVFKGKLVASKLYDSAKPVKLRFDLTNTGDEDLYVLKWHTPLEGLNSDCLMVVRNEKSKVAYDGPMIKRGHPGPEDYVLIPAGATVTADVDVGESYAVSIPGDYRVELNIQALEHVPAPAAAKKNAMLALPKSTPKLEAVTGGITKFKVKKGALQIHTRGETGRKASKALAKSTGADASAGQSGPPPTHCPQSLSAARPISKHRPTKPTSTDSIFARQPLQAWPTMPDTRNGSGAHTAARFKKVKSAFTKIRARMRTVAFTYDLAGAGCKSQRDDLVLRSVLDRAGYRRRLQGRDRGSRTQSFGRQHRRCAPRLWSAQRTGLGHKQTESSGEKRG